MVLWDRRVVYIKQKLHYNLIFLKAVDKDTGEDAPFTFRISNDTKQEVIGGEDMYMAVSRKTYINMKYQKQKINFWYYLNN